MTCLKTGGGARATQLTLMILPSGRNLFLSARISMVTNSAVPAPREWPVTTRSQPGFSSKLVLILAPTYDKTLMAKNNKFKKDRM